MLAAASAVAVLVLTSQEALGFQPGPVGRFLLVLTPWVTFAIFLHRGVEELWPGLSGKDRVRIRLGVALVAILLLGLAFIFRDTAGPPIKRMAGTSDVAVVGFAYRDRGDESLLDDLAANLAEALRESDEDGEVLSYADAVNAPLQLLGSQDHDALDQWTTEFADETNAEIVIGGIVEILPSGQISISPAVFVRADTVPDAPELAGWYQSEKLLSDQDLGSPRGRQRVLSDLVSLTQNLTTFTAALDTWRAGDATGAERGLRQLLSGSEGGASPTPGPSFVSDDLVRLFHGHSLQQIALSRDGNERQQGLEQARREYEAITSNSSQAGRAELSLANNLYLQSYGNSCSPGSVRSDALHDAAGSLSGLSSSTTLTELGRDKALVNLAQVTQCLITSHSIVDDGSMENILALLRQRDVAATGSLAKVQKETTALATSILAQRRAQQGRLDEAIALLDEALTLDSRFDHQGLWLGLKAVWSLHRCDEGIAENTWRESLRQFGEAVRSGQVSDGFVQDFRVAYEAEATVTRQRCR